MRQYLGFKKRCLLVYTSLLASTVLVTSPSKAATFASSGGNVLFTNFSQSPVGILTNTDVDTVTVGQDSSVVAKAEATASFIKENPTLADNFSFSEATGNGQNYFGLATSEAIIAGSFVIEENSFFSFDFIASLSLSASADNSETENASASGNIFFTLIDISNNSILAYFDLTGNLSVKGDNDFLKSQKTDNVTLNFSVIDFTESPKSGFAFFEGSVQRYFSNKTTVNLIEVKKNQARVSVPEYSSGVTLLISCGLISILVRRQRQKITSIYLSTNKATLNI
ncbi:MAG: hypothetical protein KME32_30025 [Mojavia pulchra JT2-VF2]|jgi:hypothetical protein|uniref:PEP-CTERM sorting domain-containing protein n=1 Tax=Mojavia pulchra JT2-VF2 TaxID=287848 RepID=A0A951UJG9_9NOST|nr:hypothetical protein [Mojavia pulchra JT2-VF2]